MTATTVLAFFVAYQIAGFLFIFFLDIFTPEDESPELGLNVLIVYWTWPYWLMITIIDILNGDDDDQR
jgi:hypothetical protein